MIGAVVTRRLRRRHSRRSSCQIVFTTNLIASLPNRANFSGVFSAIGPNLGQLPRVFASIRLELWMSPTHTLRHRDCACV